MIPTYSRDISASFNPDVSLASPYHSGIFVELKGGGKELLFSFLTSSLVQYNFCLNLASFYHILQTH